MKATTKNNLVLQSIITNNKGTFTYKLIDWIPVKKLNWNALSCNTNAIELLAEKVSRAAYLLELCTQKMRSIESDIQQIIGT